MALYRGIRAEYTIPVSGNTLVVTDGVAERDGTDSLLNIETLRFADGDVSVFSILYADLVATDDIFATNTKSLVTGDLLANDIDPSGCGIAVIASSATSMSGATVTVATDGTFAYNPSGAAALQALGFNLTTTDSFTYTISDGNGATDSATVTVTLTGLPENAILGTSGDDALAGTTGDDVITGGVGTDTLTGGLGGDTLYGGAGDDVYVYGLSDGDDVIVETGGADPLVLGSMAEVSRFDASGDDLIFGLTDGATIRVTDGLQGTVIEELGFADAPGQVYTLGSWSGGIGWLFGTMGNDGLGGGAGEDWIAGGEGADKLYGAGGSNHLFGGAGTDILYGGLEGGWFDGGSRDDRIYGTPGDDVVTGGSGADTVYANAGADTLDGGAGDDQLSGGSDKVDGLADGDVALYRGVRAEYTIQVSGNTLVVTDGVAGRDGADTLLNIETLRFADGHLLMGSAGDDILDYDPGLAPDVDGGAGTDTLRITGSGSALDLTQIADDEIIGIERFDLTGTGDNDLTLALTDLLSLSDTSNTLTVLGDAGDSVSTTDSGWTSAGTVNVGGALFDSYAQGLASLLVDQDVDQTGILA